MFPCQAPGLFRSRPKGPFCPIGLRPDQGPNFGDQGSRLILIRMFPDSPTAAPKTLAPTPSSIVLIPDRSLNIAAAKTLFIFAFDSSHPHAPHPPVVALQPHPTQARRFEIGFHSESSLTMSDQFVRSSESSQNSACRGYSRVDQVHFATRSTHSTGKVSVRCGSGSFSLGENPHVSS